MCGICGIYKFDSGEHINPEILKDMTAVQSHRGPDELSIFKDNNLGLGHDRLSIIDLSTGSQPISNEDKTVWVVFNGEIFNYLELREDLIKRGHRFKTKSDTEVLVHLYEEYGTGFFDLLNGQFAFAIWDKQKQQLLLARDRVGIRPLYYYHDSKQFIFGSEIKSLLVNPDISGKVDIKALNQIFSIWTTLGERTPFKNIKELPPGSFMIVKDKEIVKHPYWQVDFSLDGVIPRSANEAAEELKSLLIDSTRLRLRSDVPVGAYLSGGLDSSVITSIIANYTDTPLKTFSISFLEDQYDESDHQKNMAHFLNTNHNEITCENHHIGESFYKVIQHTERPILRTAPTPLYLLSGLVRKSNFKVVLTGEGADEVLGGYGIFKEDKLRRFWAKAPDSSIRPLLLKKLYPYLPLATDKGFAFSIQFFKKGLLDTDLPYYSHFLRFENTSRLCGFFNNDVKEELAKYNPIQELVDNLPTDYQNWSHLGKAQYLEMNTLLSRYLLSSQGDRMSMANSIEGRYPFLDHRVIEFCSKLPPKFKLKGLNEKYLLKKAMKGVVPDSIRKRVKQAYRAPDIKGFIHSNTPEYVKELLSEEKIKEYGLFDPKMVKTLFTKCQKTPEKRLGERDNMAFVGILSSQLYYHHFIVNKPKVNINSDSFRVVSPN